MEAERELYNVQLTPQTGLVVQSDNKPRFLFGLLGFVLGCLIIGGIALFYFLRLTQRQAKIDLDSQQKRLTDLYEMRLGMQNLLLTNLANQAVIEDEQFKRLPPERRKAVVLKNAITFNDSVNAIFKRRWTVTKDSAFITTQPNPPTPKP